MLPMSRLASSSTLLEGMEAVKFAKGDPSRKRGKEELEEMIRATQLYILSYISCLKLDGNQNLS